MHNARTLRAPGQAVALGRTSCGLLTLRKLMAHRLAVAGTATGPFLPADVPSAAKPGLFMGPWSNRLWGATAVSAVRQISTFTHGHTADTAVAPR